MKNRFLKVLLFCSIAQAFFLTTLNATDRDSLRSETIEKLTIFNEIQSNSLKSITIYTAIDSILLNKKTDNSYPATFTYTDANGTTIEKSIQIKPRGKSRRQYCSFPPLKVSFSKEELVNNGLRKKHRSLKLVTHCNDDNSGNQNVLKELLAYKLYNKLTNNSLDVQLLNVTYKDINSDLTIEKYAILIEDIDELAERMDGKEIEGYGKSLIDFEQENINTFSLFQFMIGNVDWKVRVQRNVKFIQSNEDKVLKMIPYDFDSSGLVAPAYARPFNHLGLRSMKQRLFMGLFNKKQERKNTIALFNSKKKAIYLLVRNTEQLNKQSQYEIKEYLDAFYKIINTSPLLNRAIPLGNKKPEISNHNGSMSL